VADIEKVKKGCEVCEVTNCLECPYNDGDEELLVECMDGLFKDALAVIEQLEKTVEDQKERITVLEEEAKTKGTPQKVLNRKELADLIVGECPLCGALFNNEICPTACGWCGCLLDWKDGDQE
jgi:hypothetical protein